MVIVVSVWASFQFMLPVLKGMSAFHALWQIFKSDLDLSESYDGVELFCGQKAITMAFQALGLKMVPFDNSTVDKNFDICESVGFIAVIVFILRLRPGSLVWAAPDCGSWTTLNRGTSLRSRFLPLGSAHPLDQPIMRCCCIVFTYK